MTTRSIPARNWTWLLAVGLAFSLTGTAQAGFVGFNDLGPGFGTGTNVTIYGSPGAPASGTLTNVYTGLPAPAMVTITSNGVVLSGSQSSPAYGTPAFVVFDGYVDFSGTNNPGIEVAGSSAFWTYTFTGLDPNAEYNFQGTAIRGNGAYADRWTLFEITGHSRVQSRHTRGALTTGLQTNQVAINTGDNSAGDLAWWEHIQPGPDGSFAVVSRQYLGPIPGGSSGGIKGYAMTGFRLEENPVYTGRTNVPPRLPNSAPNAINGVKTVFIILMENQNWSAIQGSSHCPYINKALLPQASYAEQYFNPHGLHPSEPNYLWLMTGTNFGIRDDNPPSDNHQSTTNTFFHQLDRAGISWRTYQENFPGGYVPDTNRYPYAVRHNPFVFFDSVRTNLAYCTNHVRPYTELSGDLANHRVARFSFITPNLTNDMHQAVNGCSTCNVLAQGDAWLAQEVPQILASPAYTDGGALFIIFDEGAGTSDGPIGMIVLSPRAKGGGYHNRLAYTHSSTLRTFQDIFGVGPYLRDAAYATSLEDLFLTLQIASPLWSGTTFSLVATNLIPGQTNYLQVSENLAGTNWVTLKTVVATQTWERLSDVPATGTGQRFYRVRAVP